MGVVEEVTDINPLHRYVVRYTADDGTERESYYPFTNDANKAQEFLRALGIRATIKPIPRPWSK